MSASTLRQRCDDACDSLLIENYGVDPDLVCNPFSSDSTVFNENRITSVTAAALTLKLGTNGPFVYWEVNINIVRNGYVYILFFPEYFNLSFPSIEYFI